MLRIRRNAAATASAAAEPRLERGESREGRRQLRGRRRLERGEQLGLAPRVPTGEQDVDAGSDRTRDQVRGRMSIGDRGHVEIVAEDEAVVAELVAQQTEHARRERRGVLGVERRKQHVRGHHAGDAGADRCGEGGQLDGA